MSSQSVIADTGPLITLIGAGQLTLLPRLYGAVVIPRQVLDEYNNGATRTDPDLETLIWMSIVDTVTLDPTLPAELGPGERAAISLAVAVSARLVLIDETRARNIARRKGLQVAGTLAVLLRAKSLGLITAVRPVIETMEAQGRRFGSQLLDDIVRQAGE